MDHHMTAVFDSPAVGVLVELEQQGFRVELLADNSIWIAPHSRLGDKQKAIIAANKSALKVLLRSCDDGVCERRAAYEAELRGTPATRIPPFLFKSSVPYVKGVCFSCGDQLGGYRFGRCWRCSLAWRLAASTLAGTDLVTTDLVDTYDDVRVVA